MREKIFVGRFTDTEGAAHEVVFRATSTRHAKYVAREWLERTDWDATFVGVERAEHGRPGTSQGRRLAAVAGITFAVSGVTIATTMIIALTLEGAV
jgi:hypothetical protein